MRGTRRDGVCRADGAVVGLEPRSCWPGVGAVN